MKHIILCADDYGQNAAISQAIVELIKAKRLSATSCLTTSPMLEDCGKLLLPLKEQIDLGLHLNLTEGKPLTTMLESFDPLKTLLLKATLRQLDKATLAAEFNAQLDKFVDVFGQLPDFLDGHQHIHQFPVIRDVVLDLYNERLRANGTYLRCTYEPGSLGRVKDVAYLKQLVIQLCGGIAFREEIDKDSIPHNNSFAGIYNFKHSHDYADFFPRFLKQINNGGLIMCHPGMMGVAGSTEEDEIITARHNEYNYFSSNGFIKVCNENHIRISRYKDLPKK
jgi:predicted glycoside hydrolase/deacetylase ChbG (UPF0249 family)